MATDNNKTRTTQDTTRRVTEEYLQRYQESIAENYQSQQYYAQNQAMQNERTQGIYSLLNSEPARKKGSKGKTIAKWVGGGAAIPFATLLSGGSAAKAAGFSTLGFMIHKLF